MRQFCFLCFILALTWNDAHSQSCLPEGITFTTQAQVDGFQASYPGCTGILGDVTISGSDITNLNGLSNLTNIGGDLSIIANPALTSLTGLQGLSFIPGDLEICGNIALTNLAGLDYLTGIGHNLYIGSVFNGGNPFLASLAGLNHLASVGGDLWLFNNISLSGLNGLSDLTSIGGSLSVEINGNLDDLSGLEGLTSLTGELHINNNYSLVSLAGLDHVTYIGGEIFINGNYNLTSLSGLENLASSGGNLFIGQNHFLANLTALAGVSSINGSINIENNPALSNLIGLEGISEGSVTDLTIINNNSLSTCDVQCVCDFISSPNGTIEIWGNATGCNSLEEIEWACGVGVYESNLFESNIQIYPNPSCHHFNVIFTLGQQTRARLEVLNRLGQVIAVIMDESLEQGNHRVTWDAEGWPAGIYFYRLGAGNSSFTGKMVLLNE